MGTHAVRPYNNDGCKSRKKMDTEGAIEEKKKHVAVVPATACRR